jgi:hypothetical protein
MVQAAISRPINTIKLEHPAAVSEWVETINIRPRPRHDTAGEAVG